MAKRITLAQFGAELQIVKANLQQTRVALTNESFSRADADKVIGDTVVGHIHDFAKQFHKNDKASMDEIAVERAKIDQHIATSVWFTNTLFGRLRWLLTGEAVIYCLVTPTTAPGKAPYRSVTW